MRCNKRHICHSYCDQHCRTAVCFDATEGDGSLPAFQMEVGQWQRETFPGSNPKSKVDHLRKEVEELAESYSPEEAADCLILLLGFADLNHFDLLNHAKRKMQINQDIFQREFQQAPAP